jgi:hypothetical protein
MGKISDSELALRLQCMALQTVGVGACTSMLCGSGMGRGYHTHASSYYLVYYWGTGGMDIKVNTN